MLLASRFVGSKLNGTQCVRKLRRFYLTRSEMRAKLLVINNLFFDLERDEKRSAIFMLTVSRCIFFAT
jgi:hypothetical protein